MHVYVHEHTDSLPASPGVRSHDPQLPPHNFLSLRTAPGAFYLGLPPHLPHSLPHCVSHSSG